VDSRLSIAQPTVSVILKEITCAINNHLLRQWIHFPTTLQEIQQIVQRYILTIISCVIICLLTRIIINIFILLCNISFINSFLQT